MEEVIRHQDQYYILAGSVSTDVRTSVLKEDETFAVFNPRGDFESIGRCDQGLYHEGTRYLSNFELIVGARRPLLLSSHIKDDHSMYIVDLTNTDFTEGENILLPRDTLHIHKSIVLLEGACYQWIRIKNYALSPVRVRMEFRYHADFVDIFEVRGAKRAKRGEYLPPSIGKNTVQWGYRGLDDVTRRTAIAFSMPFQIAPSAAWCELDFEAHEEKNIEVAVECFADDASPVSASSFHDAAERKMKLQAMRTPAASVRTSSNRFNRCFEHTLNDLELMLSGTEKGLYPYAGIPWFSTVFGRDGAITAFQCLWLWPDIARGVLAFLAHTQALEKDAGADAEPGKIIHEMRGGEMAALGEIPFGKYYGSIDSTPLFLILASAYFERTGDAEFIRGLWPAIERALKWIDVYGDQDGDGFVEYFKVSEKGLVQQGWKDSNDSVFHADGRLAEGPVALCEVQAYVFAAKKGCASMALRLGDEKMHRRLTAEAEALRIRFEDAFWCEEIGTYALALDGKKKPCRVQASNAGHCLAMGIVSKERAARVANLLLNEAFYSGWGIRTLASTEVRYNPISYHNGSVWPHDNSIIAYGFSRYGLKEHLKKLTESLFDVSLSFDMGHLPELFCGFRKRPEERPTLYPVACSPQAWAAGVWCLMLQSCLGLDFNAPDKKIICDPVFPDFLHEIDIQNLPAGGKNSVNLRFSRHGSHVDAELDDASLGFDLIRPASVR